jgi:hypothetical protein
VKTRNDTIKLGKSKVIKKREEKNIIRISIHINLCMYFAGFAQQQKEALVCRGKTKHADNNVSLRSYSQKFSTYNKIHKQGK